MADREDELEAVEVDQKLSGIRNLPYMYTKTSRATIFLGHLLCPFKKQAAIQKFLRHFLVFNKQKGQTDSGKCSLLTKKELSSHHLCLHTTNQSYAQDFANLQPFIC